MLRLMIASGEKSVAAQGTDIRGEFDDTSELSARLVKGDAAAWEEFHARTFDRLLRYLCSAAHGDEDAAREALQLTYIKSVRHVRRFESNGVMWGWLAQIARGCLIDLARKQSRYSAHLERLASEPNYVQHPTPESCALNELLNASLLKLTASERTLIEARYSADQSIQEIASATGTTPKAVESRLARIRARLRGWLTCATNHEC